MDVLRLEVYQSDWMPGYAAFLDDGKIAEDAKAHIAINLACFLACVNNEELTKDDLPYAIAESIMHEVMHALESWAGVEFSEERIESLLAQYHDKYAPAAPRYVACDPREQPEVTAMRNEIAKLSQRALELDTQLRFYKKPCAYCGDLLCDEKCKAACGDRFVNAVSLPSEPFLPET